MSAPAWFTQHLGWKRASTKAAPRCVKLFKEPIGPNLADLSSTSSTRIAGQVYALAGVEQTRTTDLDIRALEAAKERQEDDDAMPRPPRLAAAGSVLEVGLAADITQALAALDPDRGWFVTRKGGADQFAQYEHLRRLQELFRSNLTLKSTVGRDYQVSTDVMVGVPNRWEGGPQYMLHAAVSSKLTIRSDRVQNIRYEFGTLVRNRRGRLPHLVVVTAEPLPSRIVSIARGTGEIDSVYHLLYDEMTEALRQLAGTDRFLDRQASDWSELVNTQRIRPYRQLAAILASS